MTSKPARKPRKPRAVSDARFARYSQGIVTWTPISDDEAARLAATPDAYNASLVADLDAADDAATWF